MQELWFVFGLAMGIAVTGFCAIGAFERGADSVRHAPWRVELSERRRAVVARTVGRTVVARTADRAVAGRRAEEAHPVAI